MQTPVAVAAVGVEVVTIINSWCRSSSSSTGAAVALVARVVVKLRKNARKDFSWQVQSVSLFVWGAVFGDAGLHFWEIGGHTKCWVFIQNACGISKPLRTDVLRSVLFVVVQRPSPSQIIYILAEEMMFLNVAFCCCCVVSRVCAMKSLLFCILSFYMSGNVCCGRGIFFSKPRKPWRRQEIQKSSGPAVKIVKIARKPRHLVILGLSLVHSSCLGMRLLAGHGN